MQWLNRYKWQIVAGVILIAAIGISRGGALKALFPLAKLLLPILGVVVVFNIVKKKLVGAGMKRLEDALAEGMRQAESKNGPAGVNKTVDLCSDCGEPVFAGHKCPS